MLHKSIYITSNTCALTALHHVSGVNEQTIRRLCVVQGWRASEGITDIGWLTVALTLGLQFQRVSNPRTQVKTFLKTHPNGVYFIGVHKHLLVIDNGIIIDARNSTKRKITGVWKVFNV